MRTPRHALDCELTPQAPGPRVRDAMAQFYRRGEAYASQQRSHSAAYFARLLAVMDCVLVARDVRILEVGAGSAGAILAFLRTRPDATAVALELSASSLRDVAEGGGTAVRGVAGTALQLPFPDRSFDAVVAFEVIEHLPDVALAFDEMLRVLRRPGHIIIGLPNHASLWTPVEDWLRRRDRRAFGVEKGRGAWRWFRRNAALAWRKRRSPDAEFLYREPILEGASGGDADAVYYAAPLDLLRFFRARGATLAADSADIRFGGAIARFWPVELQGSTVFAWRVK